MTLPVPRAKTYIISYSQTIDAEITFYMVLQRACEDENQAEPSSTNGPLRVQGKETRRDPRFRVFCNVGHTSVAGDMIVSR